MDNEGMQHIEAQFVSQAVPLSDEDSRCLLRAKKALTFAMNDEVPANSNQERWLNERLGGLSAALVMLEKYSNNQPDSSASTSTRLLIALCVEAKEAFETMVASHVQAQCENVQNDLHVVLSDPAPYGYVSLPRTFEKNQLSDRYLDRGKSLLEKYATSLMLQINAILDGK